MVGQTGGRGHDQWCSQAARPEGVHPEHSAAQEWGAQARREKCRRGQQRRCGRIERERERETEAGEPAQQPTRGRAAAGVAGVGGGSGITSFKRRSGKGGGLSGSRRGAAQPGPHTAAPRADRHTLNQHKAAHARAATHLASALCHTDHAVPCTGRVAGVQQWLDQLCTLQMISGAPRHASAARLAMANDNLRAHPPPHDALQVGQQSQHQRTAPQPIPAHKVAATWPPTLLLHDALQVGQQAVLPLQREGHLWNQHRVHNARRKRCLHGERIGALCTSRRRWIVAMSRRETRQLAMPAARDACGSGKAAVT